VFLAVIDFCTKENFDQVLAVEQTSPYPWSDRVIRRDLFVGNSGLSYLGAFAPLGKNRLLGYAVLGEERGSAHLMNLTVLPEYRRRGIGMQLIVAVAECAVEMGFKSLALRVRFSNYAARILYVNLGFRTDKRHESFYSDGDVAHYMRVKLPLVIRGEG